MSTGEKFATLAQLELVRRKLELKISGKGFPQSITSSVAAVPFIDLVRVFVEEKTDDYTVLSTDFGWIFLMNSPAPKTFTLPAVTGADIGLPITLVKRGDGKLTIQAGGADRIQDSSAGGTFYNDLTQAEDRLPLVMLRVVAAGVWIIEQFTGQGWRTS